MSTTKVNDDLQVAALIGQSYERARQFWWVFLVLGILLCVGGIVAIAYPFFSSVAAVLVLGAILIIGGVFTIVGAFWAGKWSSLVLQLLVGILYVMVGMAIRDAPAESIAVLTLFTAAFFIVAGIFRIVVSLIERFPQWGWVFLNGLITLIAGLIIYDTFPVSVLWLIGLLLGLDLLFHGWSWVMLALFLKKLPNEEDESVGSAA
jgi:uncharacterized membrane protein HdeD (DUF308 family)